MMTPHRHLWATICGAVTVALAACSGGGTTVPPDGATCVPGQAVACACDGGGSGAATCGTNGQFAACACAAGVDARDVPMGVDVFDVAADDAVPAHDVFDAGADAATDHADAIDVQADRAMDARHDVALEVCSGTLCSGACVDTQTDVRHCGSCSVDCTTLGHVTASVVQCIAGACSVAGACASGFADCNGSVTDGCETALDTMSNCGACGAACSEPTPMCSMMAGLDGGAGFACSSGCTGGTPTRCAMMCVDTTSDPLNCGACGLACTVGPNATPVCVGSVCAYACAAGYADCDHAPGNGCEVAIANDTNNCGVCGNVCGLIAGGTPTCVDGSCGGACAAGEHVCAAACVSNTSTATCGTSCVACPSTGPNVTGASCDGTTCALACTAGFADCDGSSANGCETDLSEPANCGACGTACSGSTPLCVSSAGQYRCDLPAPRPIAPLSTARVTSQTPTLRWALPSGEDGAWVELCTDRSCSTIATAFAAVGSSGAPSAALTPGMHYWRLRGAVGTVVGTATSPVWQFRVGTRSAPTNTSWGSVPDFEGDGYADLVVGEHVYPGSAGGLSSTATVLTRPPGATFGPSSAAIGDVNGDGFVDLVLDRIWDDGTNSHLTVELYLGGASGITTEASSTFQTAPAADLVDRFLNHYPSYGAGPLALDGDVNGDGYADLVVGYSVSSASSGVGTLEVFFGSPSGLPSIASQTLSTIPGDRAGLGGAQSGAGDVNGDGYGDVVAGSQSSADSSGVVYVYEGSATGLGTAPAVRIPWTGPINPSIEAGWGAVVGRAGDVDGDGLSDIIGSAPGANSAAGRVDLYLGAALTTLASSFGPTSTGVVGVGIDGDVDLDANGYSDLLLGAPNGNCAGAQTSFVVLSLGPSGFQLPIPFDGPSGTCLFGERIAGAGDFDQDGFDDFIVAATAGASGQQTFVFYGAPTGFSSTPVIQLPDVGPIAMLSGSGSRLAGHLLM